jgi:glycosyltransferase involved in cell wall biosynthesis
VLPSEWYENAPMSVLESYACGKPVIGARVGGIPELIQPDVTGFLFESGNADDLTDALAVAAHLPDAVLTDIGREARAHVVTSFTCERYIDDMLALYREIGVAAPPRSPAPAASDSIPPVSI